MKVLSSATNSILATSEEALGLASCASDQCVISPCDDNLKAPARFLQETYIQFRVTAVTFITIHA